MSDHENKVSETSTPPRKISWFGRPATDRFVYSFLAGAFAAGALGGLLITLALFSGFNNGNVFTTTTHEQIIITEEESAIIDVVDRTRPAVVAIIGTKDVAISEAPNDLFRFFVPFDLPQPDARTERRQVSSGSGFFVSSEGLIATNRHVVADHEANYMVLTNDGQQHQALVVARDPVNDIAFVRIEGKDFPHIELADSNSLRVGQRVIAIGNALGQFRNTVTTGVISGIERSVVATGQAIGPEQIDGAIQTDAAINPGNSGGPLLDMNGRVVGINTAISTQGQLVGFALPSNEIYKGMVSYREHGRIIKPYIGVRYVMINPVIKENHGLDVEQGALITSPGNANQPAVLPDSPGDRAGLRENDIIIQVDDRAIDFEYTLARSLQDFNPGETVRLRIIRDGRERIINLTLGERTE